MKIIGVDPSITCTGLAGVGWTDRMQSHPTQEKTLASESIRMCLLRDKIIRACLGADLVCVEGPSFGSKGPGHHQLNGFWWLLVTGLCERRMRVVEIPPSCLKKYMTGRGGAKKEDMRVAAQKWMPEYRPEDNNEADALALLAMASDHFGEPLFDVGGEKITMIKGNTRKEVEVFLRALQRESLAAVKWA